MSAELEPPTLSFHDLCYDVPDSQGGPLAALARCISRNSGKGSDSRNSRAPSSDDEDVEAGGRAVNPETSKDPEEPDDKSARILSSVSGCVRRGESVAILGPSGAGKSTLLNMLSGRAQYAVAGGSVLFDGALRDSRTKRRIGYVMQDDVFMTKLTVRETLEFTAAIRMADSVGKQGRKERVDEVVGRLRLGKCLDTRIGDQQFDKGISGGERKRVNLANELLGQAEGGILLLDEPTSGLDSTSALTVVKLLRSLADDGHAILSTIHQPSSVMFGLFDNIILLSEGEVAYFGPTSAVARYFESIGFPFPPNHNPADYIMQLLIDDDELAPTDEHVSSCSQSSDAGIAPGGRRGGKPATDGSATPAAELARHYLMRTWRERGDTFLESEAPALMAAMRRGREGMVGRAREDVDSTEAHATAVRRVDAVEKARRVYRGPRRAVAKRVRSVTGRPDPTGLPKKYATRWSTQVRVLGMRALRQKRGALVDRIQLTQLTAIILICALFWFRMGKTEATLDDRLGALFFFNVFFAFFSTFSALFAFPSERAVLSKDRASGAYRLSAYFFSKTCVEIPADVIYPTIFSVAVYFAIGLRANVFAFLKFLIILIGITLTAQSMGLAISAAMMQIRQAQGESVPWSHEYARVADYM